MKEVVFDFEEFKERVNMEKPLHYTVMYRNPDGCGAFYYVKLHIFGVSKQGHIIVFETEQKLNTLTEPKPIEIVRKTADKLVETYAKPLNATPGRWEE